MNLNNKFLKRYLQPMVRSAETPRRFYTSKRRTPKGCFLFNILNYLCYELFDRPPFSSKPTGQQI